MNIGGPVGPPPTLTPTPTPAPSRTATPTPTLALPLALRSLIDGGLVSADPGARVMALREHFVALFGVGVALGVFSTKS